MKQLLHVDLLVRDADRALEFYCRGLGCTVVTDTVLALPRGGSEVFGKAVSSLRILILKLPGDKGPGEAMIELMVLPDAEPAPAPVPAARAGVFCFAILVDDIDRVLGELRQIGVAAVSPADAVQPGIRIAFVRDPEGNLVELVDERG